MVFRVFLVADGRILTEQQINSDEIDPRLQAEVDRCCAELIAEVDSNCSIVKTGSYAEVKSLLERQLYRTHRRGVPGSPFEFSLGDPGIAVDNAFYERKNRSEFMVWYQSQPVITYTLIRTADRLTEAGVFGALAGTRLARGFYEQRPAESDDRNELLETARQISRAAPAVLCTQVARVDSDGEEQLMMLAWGFAAALFERCESSPA